ncbi:unnamed protein product [Lactuca virosa]|uniref:IPO4/5-like TPR repeats domain-containing protein n=1 Tax=Lactuca virosa TaxID=75947 RepID=A0AAU9MCE4_9ASTR|nr:unnamed protein product [Lactuca virosa]
MKKLCDMISELASSILPDNGWPELFPFMFQCVYSYSPKLQESAFLIFAQLSQYIRETLIPHIKHLHGVFLQCLTKSGNSDVRIAALSHATAQEALELLIELVGTEPRFSRRQLVEVVGSMLQIVEADTLEEGTRHLAIEFMITLAEARERAPGMMRKLPQFISRLFCILLQMLLDVEDEPA